MRIKKLCEVLMLLLIFSSAAVVPETRAAFEDLILGARPAALAGAFAGLADGMEAIFLNPAGLAPLSTIAASTFYSRPFGLRELDVSAVAIALPVPVARVALAARVFGRTPYQERTLYAACAGALSPALQVGVTLKLYALSIENYGRGSAVGIDIGLLASPSPAVRWGVSVQNCNRPRICDGRDPLPQQFVTGISLEPVQEVTIAIDLVKDVRYPAEVRGGAELRITDCIYAQMGVRNNPSRFSCGASLLFKSLRIDYAVSSHYDLGITHAVSFSYHGGGVNK